MLFCRHYLSPLQNYCCFIHSSETHFLTDVVLFTLSQYLDLLVWFLSIQFNHLVLVVLFCLLSHWCCLVYQSKPLVSLLLFYLACRSTLGYWCCFVCCLTGAVWSTNHSPLSRCCCFIYHFEAPWVTGVVLSVVSLVLYGLPIKSPCLAVVVLSSLSKHLEVLVLFCLLSHWCCMVYQSKPLVSLLLFYLACRSTLGYWCCFVCCLSGFVDSPRLVFFYLPFGNTLSVWYSFIYLNEAHCLTGVA